LHRKPSQSSSPRTAKRRRTADDSDSHDLNDTPGTLTYPNAFISIVFFLDILVPTYDVYESKMQPSTSTESTCRISSTNGSNTYSTYQQQDDMNTTPKSIVESNKIELTTLRPPFSQIGIHNHVSLNLHFNNQQQQQQQQQLQQQQQSKVSPSTSDSKLISERFIESIVQRFSDTQQQQQQQQQHRTSSHPHTIEYYNQGPQTETTSNNSKPPPPTTKLFPKPLTNTAINILSSRERPITTSTNYDTSFIQPQTNEYKDNKANSNNNNNVPRLTSAADRVLPAFHTFAELQVYLQKIGLDVELVPASNTTTTTTTTEVHHQPRNIDPVQQRLSTNEQQQQYQVRSTTVNVSQQPQTVMLSNTDNNRHSRNDDAKCNRTSKFREKKTSNFNSFVF
jgi:hypothetical protein